MMTSIGSSAESGPQDGGAAVVARKYDFHLFHVPGGTRIFHSLMLPRFQNEAPMRFPCSVRASILDTVWASCLLVVWAYFCLLVVCVLVSVSYIVLVSVLVSVSYIVLLYVLVSVTYIVLVFREQNMVLHKQVWCHTILIIFTWGS